MCYSIIRKCELCIHCEMYNNLDTLCKIKEKWVDNFTAKTCDYFVLDGGSYE